MPADPAVHGRCDPRFARLRDVFAAHLADGLELGASVVVSLDGRPVADLWGGFADAARTRPWERDTLVNVYSTTKGVAALCAHVLASRGRLDLDAPVVSLWPEFAAGGKEGVRIRHLLSHTAGLPGVRRPISLDALCDGCTLTAALAEETPWWEPGTAHGYHAITFGHLVGEIVRRADGRTLGTFLREEIAGPLDADFHIGLAAEHDGRVAELVLGTDPQQHRLAPLLEGEDAALLRAALMNPVVDPSQTALAPWRRAEIPAANGHGHARSIARVYAALACGGTLDGVRLLDRAAVARAAAVEASGPDRVLQLPMHWGLGYIVNAAKWIYGPNPHSFGHTGYGGSFGFADPDARLAMGYAMNRMAMSLVGDPRGTALVSAVYECL